MTAIQVPKTLADLLRGTSAGQVPVWDDTAGAWGNGTATDIAGLADYVAAHAPSPDLSGYATTANLATQIATREPTIAAGVAGEYWRGDKTWQTLNATAAGLGNVLNAKQVTSIDLNTPAVLYTTPVSWFVDAAGAATASLSLIAQAANTVLRGPASGVPATPVFGALVAADIPSLDASKIGSGTVATARLGGGAASGTTYLRGDQTWSSVATPTLASVLAAGNTDGGAGATFAGAVAADGGLNTSSGALHLRSPQSSSLGDVLVTERGGGAPAIASSWVNDAGLILDGTLAARNSASGWRVDEGGNLRPTSSAFGFGWSDALFRRSGTSTVTLDSDGSGGAADLTVAGAGRFTGAVDSLSYTVAGTPGKASATFTTLDGKTVTVIGGLVTNVV